VVKSNHVRGFISTPGPEISLEIGAPGPLGEDVSMTETNIPTVAVDGVPDPLPAELVVLDVREQHEWDAGHIDGAVHIPLGDLPSRVGELDPQVQTLVVCHLGGRSARATQWLSAQGHDVVNMDGGMEAWQLAGRPVAR